MMGFRKLVNCTFDLFISAVLSIYPYNKGHIISYMKIFFLQAVAFSYQPAHMMSYDTVSYFFADRYSYSIPSKAVFSHIHYQISIGF